MRFLFVFLFMVPTLGQWTTSGQDGAAYVRVPGPNSITQNLNPSIIVPGSAQCPADDDHHLRRFDLDGDHGIVNTYNISSVDFGVNTASDAVITVNLYSIPNDAPLFWANMTLIGTATTSSLNSAFAIETITISGTIEDPLSTDLVVDIFSPDYSNGFTFFVGANPEGQIAPSYLSSDGCHVFEPMDAALIGFPFMHIVMSVNGVEIAPIPTLNEWGLLLFIVLLMSSAVFLFRRVQRH